MPGADYGYPRSYYITICTRDMRYMFGRVEAAAVNLNAAGRMIDRLWRAIPTEYPNVALDEYVIMPNHVHGILRLKASNMSVVRPERTTVVDVVQWFKSKTTCEYMRGVRNLSWRRFDRQLWQRSFYDHIVRGDDDLCRIRGYIIRNPMKG